MRLSVSVPPRSSWCKVLVVTSLLSAASAIPGRCGDSFQYAPLALPQESDPAWANLGNPRGEIGTDVLVAHTSLPTWSQWRLGVGPADSAREFGDGSSLQLPQGASITVDFRVRIAPDSPDLPVLDVGLCNGSAGTTVSFSRDQINVAGVSKPIYTDTSQWGDYRLVIEGTQGQFFCAQTGTSLKLELPAADWGTYIHFGFPALNEEQAVADRSFEIKLIRWYPGQAMGVLPDSLE